MSPNISLNGQIIEICCNLTTDRKGKSHGSYLIYEDDKIYMQLDTYVDNIYVAIKDGEEKKTVMHYNGAHGYSQEYHTGEWEKYVTETLYPKAKIASDRKKEAKRKKEEEEKQAKWQPVNDKHIFS